MSRHSYRDELSRIEDSRLFGSYLDEETNEWV